MKPTIYSFFICLILHALTPSDGQAQGCVAVKNMSSHSLNYGDEAARGWQFSLNYRYFRSFKHFKGSDYQEERLENHTEVINNDNSVILGVDYRFSNKWNVGLSLPYVYIDRSSLYEHDRISRHHSQSSGLGDMRITGYRSFSPGSAGSFQAGLGVKLPTGNYDFKDYFYTTDGPQLRPVDQSIQPGDGGTGIIVELNWFREIATHTSLYVNSMYLFNPRNTNGTRTYRETLSPLLANESIMSVVDQYFARLGARYAIGEKFSATLGGRLEGIPVEDLIGQSDGFRRPGYIVSAEPGLGYSSGSHFINLNVPVALYRNRTQSLTDKETQASTGTPRHGDAAFADYLVSITYAYQLSK